MRVLPAWLAIAKIVAIERPHRAAGGFQHRLWRTGVPLHGTAEARIEIGNPLCQPAEFQAGAEVEHARDAPSLKERVQQCGIAMMLAGHHGKPFADIFSEFNGDFYAIDPHLFSPAQVIVTAMENGQTYRSGRLMPELVDASFA